MTRKDRKPYRKPEVTRVRLAAEEAVLAGCKIGGSVIAVAGWSANCLDEAQAVQCSALTS